MTIPIPVDSRHFNKIGKKINLKSASCFLVALVKTGISAYILLFDVKYIIIFSSKCLV